MSDSFFIEPSGRPAPVPLALGHTANGEVVPGGWRSVPELAAGGLWSTPTDLAKLLVSISSAYLGKSKALLDQHIVKEMLTLQNGGSYGLGAAVTGSGRDLVLMKRGQNVGYQSYMLVFPNTGQGIVVMTGSDNGSVLATALIRRAAEVFHWPPLGALPD